MNLKEAFRYQNKLQWLMTEAEEILRRDRKCGQSGADRPAAQGQSRCR